MLDSLKWWKIDKCQYMNSLSPLVTVWKIYPYLPLLRVSPPSSEILAVSRLDGGTTATYFYIINIGCAYLNIINIINIVCAT